MEDVNKEIGVNYLVIAYPLCSAGTPRVGSIVNASSKRVTASVMGLERIPTRMDCIYIWANPII